MNNDELIVIFDNLLRKQLAIHNGDIDEDEEDQDEKNERYVKYAMGLGALVVAAAALYKTR